MTKFVTAALGLVVSMTVGAGLAGAHDKVPKPSVTSETIASLHVPEVGNQADDGDDAELEGTLEILHEDREDGSSHYRHFPSTHDGTRLSLEGVQHPDLLTGDRVRPGTSRRRQVWPDASSADEGRRESPGLAIRASPQHVRPAEGRHLDGELLE